MFDLVPQALGQGLALGTAPLALRNARPALWARDAQAGQCWRAEGDEAVGDSPGNDVVGVYDGLAGVGGGGMLI